LPPLSWQGFLLSPLCAAAGAALKPASAAPVVLAKFSGHWFGVLCNSNLSLDYEKHTCGTYPGQFTGFNT
ncbi:MAG: hypothetical protein LPK03_00970, partial [Pontibacter sp.]|nr:hypothetical protein [Pontibacter sp.]